MADSKDTSDPPIVAPTPSNDEINQELVKADLPTVEQQKRMEDIVKEAIPQYANYVGATFKYLSAATYKLAISKDRDETSKQIADDLKAKWDNFMEDRKNQREATKAETTTTSETKVEPST